MLALEKTVDGYVVLEDFLYNPGLYVNGMREVSKSELAQALKRLREQGLIEEDNINTGKVIFKLTDMGRESFGSELSAKEWDGKWRIVIFDIPEEKRAIRNLFRRNLKKWGFKYLQKSVWISKMDVFGKLTSYIEGLRIEKWVTIIEADKLSHYHNT